jgi:phage-related protein
MPGRDKPIVWLAGEIKTPPFAMEARIEAGLLLRRLQRGEQLAMPHATAMPSVGRRCLELRVRDEGRNWRIMVRVDEDAVIIADVFAKKTRTTPKKVIEACRERLKRCDQDSKG